MNHQNLQKENLLAHLQKFNQEHLFFFYSSLSTEEQKNLIEQIKSIDFDLIKNLSDDCLNLKKESKKFLDFNKISAPKFDTLESIKKNLSLKNEDFNQTGLNYLSKNKVIIVTLAGGDGSRLQYNKPKGLFPIFGRSLFERQAKQIKKLNLKTKTNLLWVIITNPNNQEKIISFFKKNQYFQLLPQTVRFYPQETMPCIDQQGKIILSSPQQIAFSPNGNGSLFSLFQKTNLLTEMKQNKIEYIFVCNIDNPLTRIADPFFLGYTIKNKLPVSNKAVLKKNPQEKVGVFVQHLKQTHIIEYSDFPIEKELSLKETFVANIGVHYIHINFIIEQNKKSIPYHYAHKKIPFINKHKETIVPEIPNGYKFEKFIFDFFSRSTKMGILVVNREEEFSPLKNKEGTDSIETVENNLRKQKKV